MKNHEHAKDENHDHSDSDERIEKTIEAGKILSEVREESKKWIKPGMKLEELADKIESAIIKKGAQPAFPANLSINDIAAHYTPHLNDQTVLNENDVLKVDIGAHIDGFVTDSAYTICHSGENQNLIDAAKNALDAAIASCKPGVLISDISTAIEKEITALGFKPIENLTGHGVGQFIVHQDPAIPNIPHKSPKTLEDGMIIAIEPFATNSRGRVHDTEICLIFRLDDIKPVRNPISRKIIEASQKYNGLPFAERWMQRDLGVPAFSFKMAMKELLDKAILYPYPALKEQSGSLVSQFEHTIIIQDKPIVATK